MKRSGWPDYPFSFHDSEELGPAALAKLSRKTGLQPGDLNNNGNVTRQVISIPQWSEVQDYSYDKVNRLMNAEVINPQNQAQKIWREAADYDAAGNRWVSTLTGLWSLKADTPQAGTAFDSRNRVSGWGYDSAGNVTA